MSEDQTMVQKAFAQIGERFDGIEKLLKREKEPIRFIRSQGIYYPSKETTNNGSFINTAINPTAQIIVEIVCRVTPGSTFQHWSYCLGSQTANDNVNTFALRGNNTVQTNPPWTNYRWGHSVWQNMGITTPSWSSSSDWHTIRVSRSGLVLDGVLYAATKTTNTSVPNKPIFIGCINRNGTATNCIPLDICSMKIWNSETLIFNGIASENSSQIGLYDSITNSLFTSSQTSYKYLFLEENS